MDAMIFLSKIPKFSTKVGARSSATIATDANEAGGDIEETDAVESGKRGNI